VPGAILHRREPRAFGVSQRRVRSYLGGVQHDQQADPNSGENMGGSMQVRHQENGGKTAEGVKKGTKGGSKVKPIKAEDIDW
jgi:hypothetical protein